MHSASGSQGQMRLTLIRMNQKLDLHLALSFGLCSSIGPVPHDGLTESVILYGKHMRSKRQKALKAVPALTVMVCCRKVE